VLKIFSHIVLSFLLLISTIGLVVSKHYCSGEMISVSVYYEADSCCDMGGCCENENHTYQVKDDYSSSVITTIPFLAELDILGHDLFETGELTAKETEILTPFVANAPPPKTIQKILSLKQVYLL
jgi:hypothetical protein